ncbi:VOC family protein [Niallia nealsonii]|uniref:PhnB-like domain-containing protein n=1 Tax=Niallia nealsonii TaxID=115979 RepID=A0A2N0Z7A2_9BACI|nr:VOC family protein [Niallia nealsonii]PKG25363.1 hypothetical protein CWS01_02470 [Niallia nealsonii]
MKKVIPFLMFQGNAAEAINTYTSIIEDSSIINITHYGPNEAGAEGSVMSATFRVKDQEIMCIDSSIKHNFTFTPSFSLYIICDNEEEINKLFEQLSGGGSILMPLDNYGFSKRFGWFTDKFGVSWQLNLE